MSGTEHISRLKLNGIPLDRVDLDAAMRIVADVCTARRSLHIATVSVNFFTLARRNRAFHDLLKRVGLAVIDGRPLLWLVRLADPKMPAWQVTGHDLVHAGAALAARSGWGVYLLGGEQGIAQAAAERLARDHPGLRVTGSDGGRFGRDGRAEDEDQLLATIRAFAPQLLFVALGAPKQELWIDRALPRLPPTVAVGVGGVLDTLAGRLPRAPRWVQLAGLESPFQLLIRPRRYARRYLLDDPPTFLRLAASAVRVRLRSARRAGRR